MGIEFSFLFYKWRNKMEQPKYYEYMLPELQILKDKKVYNRNDLIELAAEKLKVSEEQKEK